MIAYYSKKNGDSMKNILIFGNGAVALQLYISLKNQNNLNLSLKIRESLNSKKFIEELNKFDMTIECICKTNLNKLAYGKSKINYIKSNSEISDVWETFIFSTPSNSYLQILKDIDINNLKKLKLIILISPEFTSSILLENYLISIGRNDIEIISFNNYYGATNFIDNSSTKIILNALKKKIYIGSNKNISKYLNSIIKFMKNLNIFAIICKNSLIAESKNINTFVHLPLLFNEISLNQIFLKDKQKRYLYKLYPEGPITKYVISDMLETYYEIMELYEKMGIEKINLLKFLNDSYPVLDESIKIQEINSFCEKSKIQQEYLLYVRYTSILIDPFSKPNEDGEYFDFSKVNYSYIFKNKDDLWTIPRRPFEDYSKLELLYNLTKIYNTNGKTLEKYLNIYKNYCFYFLKKYGKENINLKTYIFNRKKESLIIKNFINKSIL